MGDDRWGALAALWRRERQAARDQFVALRRGSTVAERAARGLALTGLEVGEERAAPRERSRVRLQVPDRVDLDDLQLGPGDPVVVWRDGPGGPDGDGAVRGVLVGREGQAVWVMLDRWLPDALGPLHLDAEAAEVTFGRGDQALAAVVAAKADSALGHLRAVLEGARPPVARPAAPALRLGDDQLDELQQRAVALALAAVDVALIHGPPGTGKTRTLVEIVAHKVAAGERVLCTAPSNTAVDNLGERLAARGLPVVRLGHPARVAPGLAGLTLDAQVDADGASALARQWRDRALALRKGAHGRTAEARARRDEARALDRDAAAALATAEQAVLARARVVLATCVGAAGPVLADARFGTVVLDEATQAPDPVALCALGRGGVAILAGDPCQLGPTVIDPGAARAGLASTFFERLLASAPAASVMLELQHRMHADIMAFPSRASYHGRLRAAPAVAGHDLAQLGVRADPDRPGALWLCDSAGKDWTEEQSDRAGADPSTANPGHAVRVAAEVRRLLSRGLAPTDLAVIAAYSAQVRQLRHLLGPERAAGLEVGTVDGFQGREKEVVVVDTVRSNEHGELGFLAETRRMNVALTRARRFLLVVLDSATVGGHPYYGALLAHADAIGAHGSAWADEAEPL
ncbi:MAG: AAA family ATPase [Kofleriaceae bacterium]|nr:AAA family ATPase [Kofleriaceae bacterium]